MGTLVAETARGTGRGCVAYCPVEHHRNDPEKTKKGEILWHLLQKLRFLAASGQDPEVRYTQSGSMVASFNLAVSERRKDASSQQKEDTSWFRVVAWGKKAELAANYLSKGKLVLVEGWLQKRSWEDSQSGEKKYATDIVAHEITFLEKKEGGEEIPFADEFPAEGDHDVPF